jgi:hypothetical protein
VGRLKGTDRYVSWRDKKRRSEKDGKG